MELFLKAGRGWMGRIAGGHKFCTQKSLHLTDCYSEEIYVIMSCIGSLQQQVMNS